MPRIIPNIFKDRLGRELLYLVNFSMLESCFRGQSKDDIYLDLYFMDHSMYQTRVRERAEEKGYEFFDCFHDPDRKANWRGYGAYKVWWDVERPVVVQGSSYAVPQDWLSPTGLNREVVRHILIVQIHRLIPDGLPADGWRFSMTYFPLDRKIDCRSEHVNWGWARPVNRAASVASYLVEDVARALEGK
jgi:hypothetical protein